MVATMGQSHLTERQSDNHVWMISHNALSPALKGTQSGGVGAEWSSGYWLLTLTIVWVLGAVARCPASQKKMVPLVRSPENVHIQNSKYASYQMPITFAPS